MIGPPQPDLVGHHVQAVYPHADVVLAGPRAASRAGTNTAYRPAASAVRNGFPQTTGVRQKLQVAFAFGIPLAMTFTPPWI